jgi:hypothetical protein
LTEPRSTFGDAIVEFPVVFKVVFKTTGRVGEINSENDK